MRAKLQILFNKLRTQLIVSHALPVLVFIPILGFTLVYLLETQYVLGTLAGQLTDQAALVVEFTQDDQGVWSQSTDAMRLVERLRSHIDARLMILDAQGKLLASSLASDASRDGQLMNFPVVQQALQGKKAWQIDYNPFMSAQIVDTALPVSNNQGQVIGIVRLSYNIAQIENETLALRGLVFVALLIAAGFALLLALLLARSISQPLSQMAEAVGRLSPGKPPLPLSETGPEEVRTVAVSYNQLAKRLYALELERRQFLASIVHELGTPLGAIKAAAQALQYGATEDPELSADLVAGIGKHVDQLRLLIDDLTLFGETEVGALTLRRDWINLEELIQTQCLAFAYLLKQKNIELTYHIRGDLPAFYGDPSRLGQVLANLLNNAFKYTPPGGKVTVEADLVNKDGEQRIVVQVSDTGPGIAAKEQERIFDVFYRSPQQKNRQPGMGLGLVIARRLAEAHDGILTVHSNLGHGSTFELSLPVPRQAPEAQSPSPALEVAADIR
ncbi:MAG TPA: ATP-binding protein [Phototrophicaceae bacterium]|nr:ATP-binding protein [Phototrophicaceae bacterium]